MLFVLCFMGVWFRFTRFPLERHVNIHGRRFVSWSKSSTIHLTLSSRYSILGFSSLGSIFTYFRNRFLSFFFFFYIPKLSLTSFLQNQINFRRFYPNRHGLIPDGFSRSSRQFKIIQKYVNFCSDLLRLDKHRRNKGAKGKHGFLFVFF